MLLAWRIHGLYVDQTQRQEWLDEKLKDLPNVVGTTLLDCAEDMLGYGRDELKYGAVFDKSKSRFFISLGKNDEERCPTFENLVIEKSIWRKQLLRALQRALNDIRCRKCGL